MSAENRSILHHALGEAARLLRSDGAMAYLLDPATGILRFADDAGITDDRRRQWVRTLEVKPGVGLFGRAVAERRIVQSGDYPNDPSFVHFPGADRLVRSLAIRSLLVAPLIAGERVFGAMGTYSSRADAFGEHDVALVRALADHAAAAMANAELIEQLARSRAEVERRAEAERALRELGARITALRDPGEVLQMAVDEAARLLGADGARIDLLDARDGALYWAYDATTGRRPGLGPIGGSGEARAGEGISGRAVRELRAVFTDDYLSDDRFEHAEAPDAHVRKHAIRSVVAVPLIGDRGPLGTLTVYTAETNAFDEADARLLEALAGQAAIAMTNAGLIERLAASQADERRRADEERALREIAARITAIRDPSDLLQDVVDEAARLLRAERVRIDLIGRGAGRVGYTFMGAGPHIGGAAVDEDGEPYSFGASGKALAERRTVVVGDYEADRTFEHVPELDRAVGEDGIRSLVVTPLIAEDDLLGVLQVGSLEVDAFGPHQIGLAEALAHQAAIAIHNSRLIQALERSGVEIRRRATAEQALREIATRITAIRDPAELLQQVTDSARRLLDGERSQLDIVDPATGLIRWTTASGEGRFGGDLPGTHEGVAAEVGINSMAIAARAVVATADYLADPRIRHIPASDAFVRQAGIRSVLAAPLLSDTDLLGILKVATTRVDAFDDEDAALMAAFADQVVVAIQNARLIDELGRSREEISRRADAERSVRQIAANISALRDVEAILQQTVDEARRLLDSSSARIDMLDDDGVTLRWAYASGQDAIRTREVGFDREFVVGEGIAGLTVRTGMAFRSGDYLADERFVHVPRSDALVEATGFRSVLSAPLLGETGPLGAISVSSELPDRYDDAQAELLQGLADQAAIAIQNARLIAELNESRSTLARRADEERAVREIAARISATKGAQGVLQRTVDEAARLLGADQARIDLVDDHSGLLRWAYHSATTTTPGSAAAWPDPAVDAGHADEQIDEGVSGIAVRERRVAWTGDYLHDPAFVHGPGPDAFAATANINSVMSAPLLGEGVPFGAITIYTSRLQAWDDEEARLLEAIATQASIAIQTARLIEELDASTTELARRADAEQSLREIAAQITATRDPGSLLQQVVDAARRLVGADGAVLDLVDPGGELLRWAFDAGVAHLFTADEIANMTIPVGVGATGQAVAENRVITAGDDPKRMFPDSAVNDRFFDGTGYRSMIVAPISGDSGPLGALEVYATRPGAFDDDDAGVIRSLAAQAAIAITNARLIEELNRSRREVGRRAAAEQSLREIAARITAIRETGELLQHVADEAARLLDSEGAIIDLLDPISGSISVGYVAGLDPERTGRWAGSRVGEDIVRRALASRSALFTVDYLDDERFTVDAEAADVARGLGVRSIAIAPLVSERGALGTIAVFSPEPGRFGEDQANLLAALADQAAIAMLNASLIDELERSQGELEARAETERSLRDISARITSLGDPGEILARVVEESRRLLRSDGAHLTRMSEDGTYLVPVIVAGGMDVDTESWLKNMQFPLGGGINGLAAEDARAVWTYDYPADPRIPHEPGDDEAAARLGLRAMAAAPLRAPAGEVIGTLAISYAAPREILPDELDLLQGLADQAAIALANSNLYELLGESEARYRHLVQNSPDLVWSIDADARFTFISDTCQRLTGWRAEELLGRHFGAIVHESSREVAEIDWTAGIGDDPESADRELRGRVNLLHRDGHPVPAEFIAFATRDESGAFAGANGSVRDMSERDRLERELRESEERYRFLVENSPDIIFSTDAEGVFTYVSDSIERITGFTPAEYTGNHFSLVVDPPSVPAAAERWNALLADPATRQVVKLELRRKDGGTVPVEVSSIGTTVDGAFAGIHGATRDITERERLERDLRRQAAELSSSQERAHLARELHDSVTQALFSMTLVTRSVELLIDRDPAVAKEKLGSLRDLQREALAEMRALIFELRPGNLENDGLLPALRTHTAALQGRIGLPVVVTSELAERLPLEIEEVLYRIAQEALHNVVKHAAARQVEVAIDRRGADVVLRVRDDGKGFDAGAVPEGHLGLTGMRARADKIGATCHVTSRAGEGTTVEVVVPPAALERADGAGRAPATGAPAAG